MKALAGDEKAYQNYEWIMLEMYDQSVRHIGGGEMKKYLHQANIPNEPFVKNRVGKFFDQFRKSAYQYYPSSLKSFLKKILPIVESKKILIKVADKIFGSEYKRLGKFRLGGEIHQWMYDRLSLHHLLLDTGFKNPCKMEAEESLIPGWKDFHLDTDSDGSQYKADSLYMEASK